MRWLRSKGFLGTLAVLVIGGGATYYYLDQGSKSSAKEAEQVVVEAKKTDIRFSVSGTSQLEPKDTQNIVSPADGTIKTMNLTRNQDVKAGQLLFEISSPTLDNNYQKAISTYNQLQKDLTDLYAQQDYMTTKAPISGKFTLADKMDVGATVTKNSLIGTISDNSLLLVTIPFALEDAVQFAVGTDVDLSIDGFMLSKSGKIVSIGKDPRGDMKGGKMIDVEISVANDATMEAGLKAKGSIYLNGRYVDSKDSGTLRYSKVVSVMANVAGTVNTLNYKTGNYVYAGDVISKITNDTLKDDIVSKQSAIDLQKISVEDFAERIKGLKVTAPFDGVFSTDFVNKRANTLTAYTPGAKIQANAQLGAVASMSTMQLPIQVDELDLPNIRTGMKAEVKVDSIQGRIFDGEVSQVSTVGTTTNGVTFYDVVLTVKNANQLKIGMTATGEILIQDKKNIITLPNEALQQGGGKRFVTLKKEDGTLDERHEIKIGIRSKTEVEITEGLKEGDKVLIPLPKKSGDMSQADIDALRQQFQQNAGAQGAAGGLTQEQIQQLREQFGAGGGQQIRIQQGGGGAAPGGATGGTTGGGGGGNIGGGGNFGGGGGGGNFGGGGGGNFGGGGGGNANR
ncbi:efflux RND transporter periplasmic adaptor subunit [Paenibacillus koleovorans]|uniref:efflux RND transporter periplasmic adaptor subunit n=1 Tax=Paenibacillus koleovorans TaxID=121608 RepID=UPI000FDC965C|nr:efflux RND transporter periplasmic adaptor subunit [Paenibacillus koleovorans]